MTYSSHGWDSLERNSGSGTFLEASENPDNGFQLDRPHSGVCVQASLVVTHQTTGLAGIIFTSEIERDRVIVMASGPAY